MADGPEIRTSGRPALTGGCEPAEQLRKALDDRRTGNDAHVQVGDERQSSPSLARPAVQRDCPGLGARTGAGRERGVEGVELARCQRGVDDHLDAAGSKRRGEVGGDADPKGAVTVERLGDGTRHVVGENDLRPVVAHALDESSDELRRGERGDGG